MDPECRESLQTNFTKAVKGYHLIHEDPIKDTQWESINAQILKAIGCEVTYESKGSHKSGLDIQCSFGALSNKSAKYECNHSMMKISSYRLTTVCSNKNHGDISDILAEIKRRKNFKYYSIVVRKEEPLEFIYDWYLLPADLTLMDPSTYEWRLLYGKRGDKKDQVKGWETNKMEGCSMSINFDMSSQLWMNIGISPSIREHLVSTCRVSRDPKYNFISFYENEENIIKTTI